MPSEILKWAIRVVWVGFVAWCFLRMALDTEGWMRWYWLFWAIFGSIFAYWWMEMLLLTMRRNRAAIFMLLFVFSIVASSVYGAWHPDNRFIVAADKGEVQAVRRYIEKGGNVNTVGSSLPMLHDVLAKVLLKGRDRAEYSRFMEKSDITALHRAAGSGHREVVELLIEAGANPNARTNEGVTPLHWGLGEGIEMVSLLVEAGAEVNAADDKGSTPLHWAASTGFNNEAVLVREVMLLINHGANINAKASNAADYTPLHAAAMQGRTQLVELLIDRGAEINARMSGEKRKTPLTLAIENDRAQTADLLKRHGAVE